MIVSKKQKYKSLKNSNLNNKSVLILDSFISCMNKKSHNINIPTNINTLGYRCFYDCENIKSLYVPPNISNIEKGAFYNCKSLEKIELPKELSDLKDETFYNCSSLQSINIPDDVSYIGERCFLNCENLKEINFSNKVKSINDSAFKNCSNLTKIQIPNSVEVISKNVFFNCFNLEEVILPDNIDILESCLFANCKKLNKINIGQNITEIKELAFFECSSLSSLDLPQNLSNLGSRVFSNCTNLQDISLPNSIVSIGQGIFSNCTNLIKVTLPNKLTYIPSSTFNNCINLEEINLPKTVKQIDNSAFSNCKKLKTIDLPETLQSIGSDSFSGCEKLNHITLPDSLKNIGTAAFYDCKSLSEINIPNTINTLSPLTFANCSNLEKINLPKIFDKIPDSCFANCTNLYDINLPETLNYINSYAFSNCSSLENIRLPKSIKMIGERAFNNCTNLRKIIIPKYIKSISNSAFDNCNNLVIYGEKNSYAHKYAIANKIDFEEYKFISLRGISIKNSFISMLNNNQSKLDLVLYPENTNDIFKVKWSSSDENIVSVKDGIITSHNVGIVTITAQVGYNKIAKCIVQVERPLESIKLETDYLSLNKSESKSLKIEYFPKNHTCTDNPVWKSSDENIVKVDSYGNITAISKGDCIITCTLDGKSDSCKVNVDLPLKEITLDKTSLNLKCNESYKLNISYIPEDTTDVISLNWSCMDSSIVAINDDGTIKALNPGTTVITASANNKIATCIVTVRSCISAVKFKDDRINLKVDDSLSLEILDQNNDYVENELITWNISDSKIAKIENNRLIATNEGTTVIVAQVEGLIAAAILNVSLKKIRLFDVNYLKSSSNIITGKGIVGATVKAFNNNELISDTCIINSDKKFLLHIEPQEPGSEIRVEISKHGYETKEEVITSLYEFNTFYVDSVETLDSNNIYISGRGCSGAYIRAYIKNTQIGKACSVNSDGHFKMHLPKIKSDTVVTLKMRQTNYVTANKNIIIP